MFKQRGAFLGTWALLLTAILVAVLAVSAWLKKDRDEALRQAQRLQDAEAAAPAADTPAKAAAPRPIGFGLTFALIPGTAPGVAVAHLGCHGQPADLQRPHQGSCNPYAGDTSCRVVLPVLCFQPGSAPVPPGVESGFYQGWTSGSLGATQPVMGALLESLSTASARCEGELGPGWRMAEFHDGQGGWGIQGLHGSGLSGQTRFWVHINDQPGNCWNSSP